MKWWNCLNRQVCFSEINGNNAEMLRDTDGRNFFEKKNKTRYLCICLIRRDFSETYIFYGRKKVINTSDFQFCWISTVFADLFYSFEDNPNSQKIDLLKL